MTSRVVRDLEKKWALDDLERMREREALLETAGVTRGEALAALAAMGKLAFVNAGAYIYAQTATGVSKDVADQFLELYVTEAAGQVAAWSEEFLGKIKAEHT